MRGVGIAIAIAIVMILGGAAFWQRDRLQSLGSGVDAAERIQDAEQRNAAEISDLKKQLQDVQKQLQGSAPQIADLKNQLSSEQGERKVLSDQVGALSARVDGLVKANAAEPLPPEQGALHRRRR
jgi:uncharacterized protein HemX